MFSCEQSKLNTNPSLPNTNDIEVRDGALHFKNIEIFKETTDLLSTFTDEELNMWESTHNFQSYRSIFSKSADEFHELISQNQYNSWLKKYDDILYLKSDEVTPKLPVYFYQMISNRNGIFYIGSFLHKAWGDRLITITDKDKSKLELAFTMESSSEEDGIIIQKFSGGQIIQLRDEDDCYPDNTGAKSYFERDGDRRAYIEIETLPYPYGPVGNAEVSLVSLDVYGYKKGIFGGFNLYKTLLACDQVSFRLLDHEGVAHTISNYSRTQNYEAKHLHKKWYLGDGVVATETPIFDWVQGRSVTRGTGDDGWAVICCDVLFPSNCPISSGSDPFP